MMRFSHTAIHEASPVPSVCMNVPYLGTWVHRTSHSCIDRMDKEKESKKEKKKETHDS
jgi:hypothetical protein